jgi:hypothetical protein
MKTYRIQVRYAGKYWDNTISAADVDAAGMDFVNKVKAGSIYPVSNEPLYRDDICFITYEEVANVTTQQAIRQEA